MFSVYNFKETILLILPSLANTIGKNHPLMEPISLQDLENSSHSQTWKKKLSLQVPQV